MKSETRKFINELADSIRDAFSIDVPIINMRKVVTIIGGEIEEGDPFDFDELYDGTIKKNKEDSFLIKISPLQSKERENFTIAHEIGHLFLHMGYIILPEIWEKQDDIEFTRFGNNEQEYQAHEFAAAFLMPKEEYKRILDENTKDNRADIKSVAKYFNVSMAAATNRGKFLGYIKW